MSSRFGVYALCSSLFLTIKKKVFSINVDFCYFKQEKVAQVEDSGLRKRADLVRIRSVRFDLGEQHVENEIY